MANKHAAYDLAQMQSLPLEAKILMAKRRIQEWYDYWVGMGHVFDELNKLYGENFVKYK